MYKPNDIKQSCLKPKLANFINLNCLERVLLIIVLLTFSTFKSYTQSNDTLLLDLNTLSFGMVDFDTKVVLKIPVEREVTYVNYLHLKKGYSWKEQVERKLDDIEKKLLRNEEIRDALNSSTLSKSEKIRLNKRLERKAITIPTVPFRIDENNGKKTIVATFDGNNRFRPNSNYAVIVFFKDNKGVEIFNTYHQNKQKGLKQLKEYTDKYEKEERIKILIPDSKELGDLYKNKLKVKYDSINKFQLANDGIKQRSYQLCSFLLDVSKCIVNDTINKHFQFNDEELNSLFNMVELSNDYTMLINGDLTLKNLQKIAKSIEDRHSNLSQNIEFLNQLKSKIEYLNYSMLSNCFGELNTIQCSDEKSVSANMKQFNDLISSLQESRRNIEQIIKEKNKISKIITDKYFTRSVSYSTNSYITGLKTRGKLRIIPSFGVVGFGEVNGYGFGYISPYLGFNINLTPIKKDIPLANYPNKNWKHHFSLMFGWTLTDISKSNKRESLYKNSSFLTGINYRLSHSFHLSAGCLWFQKIDSNPIVSDKSIATVPFVGISLDLDLKEYMNNLNNIFK